MVKIYTAQTQSISCVLSRSCRAVNTPIVVFLLMWSRINLSVKGQNFIRSLLHSLLLSWNDAIDWDSALWAGKLANEMETEPQN